ncbi:MAG: alanine/glycine:cation symporter family protein [Gammaproteobacteria bacterium]
MTFDAFWATTVGLVWGLPLVITLGIAGAYFTILSRLLPLRKAKHALEVLFGRHDSASAPGELSHFKALTTALSATIGMGNIAGVAVAITMGGSGAVFWMWMAGLLGMATKFFTCSLAVMYRKPDEDGVLQGGPMYTIELGLGRAFKPLAIAFAACGMIGCLGIFQANQLANLVTNQYDVAPLLTGLVAMIIVAYVLLGGVKRLGNVTGFVVPTMVTLYILGGIVVVFAHREQIPAVLASIILGAFDPSAMLGGGAGLAFKEVLVTGVKRAVFSNEAGVGTAALAHATARTTEPIREGLVAMLGPFIDTIIVCTITALVILTSGVPNHEAGVVMTATAFDSAMPGFGAVLLTIVFTLFALSTMVSYAYYSQKCARYLFGKQRGGNFLYVYLALIPCGAVWHPTTVINIIDTAFALMVIPNLIATLILAPKVLVATRDYFQRY